TLAHHPDPPCGDRRHYSATVKVISVILDWNRDPAGPSFVSHTSTWFDDCATAGSMGISVCPWARSACATKRVWAIDTLGPGAVRISTCVPGVGESIPTLSIVTGRSNSAM